MNLRLMLQMALVLAFVSSTRAAEPDAKESAALAARIDQLLGERWAAANLKPADAASDSEFLRRVYLDLAGMIPPAHVTREFLDDKSPDKRQKLVEKLLSGQRYVSNFTVFWRSVLLPESTNGDNLGLRASFEAWLRTRLEQNAGFDRMAREILATAQQRRRGQLAELDLADGQNQGISPIAFDLANESKPENLAGSTARLFLAVKLECAQCHNHPHAEWTQDQFWAYAAFFGGSRSGNNVTIHIPKSNKTVSAKFPNGQEPNFEKNANARTVLADWITAAENPYFAKATVNRVWSHFFGNGLVEPVDDLTQEHEKNPLLEELAKQFVQHKFDLKYLIRAIVSSRAYQATSIARNENSDELRLFARMPVRALSPEQIYESLAEVTRIQEERDPRDANLAFVRRAELQARFVRQTEKATEAQTSILQALALMNGKLVDDATSLEQSQTLGAIAGAPYLDTAGKVEQLYLTALSRKPRAAELERFVKYVSKGGPSGDPQRALADVFWVLLNSGEFLFNH
jgi:Protein of unknown function (DUF1549)/Protein of unknown function (DUF1553)